MAGESKEMPGDAQGKAPHSDQTSSTASSSAAVTTAGTPTETWTTPKLLATPSHLSLSGESESTFRLSNFLGLKFAYSNDNRAHQEPGGWFCGSK